MPTIDLAELGDNAAEAAAFLKLAANEKRLLILCHLHQAGETPVTALAEAVGLSQSALSQHLAGLRDGGFVTARREGQTIYYALADRRTVRLLKTLKEIFCP